MGSITGTGVGLTEKEETYLELKEELDKRYGPPKTIKDKNLGKILQYNLNRIILIPQHLQVECSDNQNPREINRLITKLSSFN